MADTTHPNKFPEDPKHLRLTLRTLLAYLDDVLEPAQAREIGAKIQQTPYASQLVERIQEVLRRRRVSAPELKGPGVGLDPNTVAEYLDNTLPVQAVPDVERVCLESDMHLAEVAACHQILTLVIGEPLHVSPERRERLYALIPEGLAAKPADETSREPAGAAAQQSAAASAPGEVRPSTNGGTAPARSRFAVPDYLKPTPFWKRALIPMAVVLIFLAWLGLIVFDPSLLGTSAEEPQQVAQNDQQKAVADSDSSQDTTPAEEKSSSAASGTSEEEDMAERDAPIDFPDDDLIPLDAPAPEDMAEDQVPGNSDDVPLIPLPTLPEAPQAQDPDEEMPDDPPPAQAEQQAPANPDPQSPQVIYTTKAANSATKNGMLLRYDEATSEWGTLPPRAFVMPGEQLACPEPLDATFRISEAHCDVTFIGGLLGSFHSGESPAGFKLDLRQGKAVFARTDEENNSVHFTIQVGEEEWQVELVDAESRCGIEIVPRFPSQFEKGLGSEWYMGMFWVSDGQVRIKDRTGSSHLLSAQQALDVTPQPPGVEAEAMVQMDQTLPEWLNPAGRDFLKLHAQYVRQLHAAFYEADLESDVTMVLLPLAKNERTPPQVAVMAAKTLAMTGSLRDVADLLSLSAASPAEVREATIQATRQWLTLHPTKEDGRRLRSELRQNFLPGTADAIYRLLWGYRRSDLQDKSQALALVDWLDHDNVTVRTLAFLHLREITGRTNNYRPLHSAAQRNASVNRWRDDVNSGRLF